MMSTNGLCRMAVPGHVYQEHVYQERLSAGPFKGDSLLWP